ncbi:MAG: hypothetical protein WBW34_08970 [Nitrososphaeraceae archaeon]
MNFFPLRILSLSAILIAGFFHLGNVIGNTSMAAWAQAVPLITVQTGNVTLDQGLPIFYDCIDDAVDESYSEQEPNYFHEEPTKTEVNSCYNDVFVVNGDNLKSVSQIEDSNNNDIDEKSVMTEDQNDEETRMIQSEDTTEDTIEEPQQQGPESFIVVPW